MRGHFPQKTFEQYAIGVAISAKSVKAIAGGGQFSQKAVENYTVGVAVLSKIRQNYWKGGGGSSHRKL